MELLLSRLNDGGDSPIRVATADDKIYKDECVYSFDSPDSETGLYVCMKSFLGLGRNHVERHHRKTRNCIYLHLKRIKREIVLDKLDNDEDKRVTKMAIGVAGGFDLDGGKKYEYDEMNSIVVLPEFACIPLPNDDLPPMVTLAVDAILSADSAATVERTKALSGTWDGEKRIASKHAENLIHHETGIRIPPRDWKCEMCDKTDNLWLNLTDGTILCGRRFFDGSGGNNHALEHYKETGYPLAVKLGTITPDGADVFSYDEDEMVEDPQLTKHLAHFGINISLMEKTDKSIAELEIDMNKRIGEWATIQESGSHLVPVYGSGYTGIANLGNSCYLNSVIQVVFSIPDFKTSYADATEAIFESCMTDPVDDFGVQMAKLGHGLLSGEYSTPKPPPEGNAEKDETDFEAPPGIKLGMFKSLIGKGHHEFSTNRQQDAQEFFLHLINVLERHNRGAVNPADCFKYQEEDRILCVQSSKVKYVYSTQYILRLPIPLEQATNKDEVASYELKKKEAEARGSRIDPVRARIPMDICLKAFAAPKTVPDFYSSALNAKSMALKTVRLASFPDYLMIQLEKFTFEDGWIPKKLDVSIDVPDVLDLEYLRGTGLRPDEQSLPEENAPPIAVPIQLDEVAVLGLAEMGFPMEACKRAVYTTANQGLEAAMSWIMEHMNDPDFGDPFVVEGASESVASGVRFIPNAESIGVIMSMGFSREQACRALRATDNILERAADWIFSHADELDSESMDTTEPRLMQPKYRNGTGKYRLVAFISHMGSSTMVGHYVCHILKNGRWVIFNDEKVALSESPPKDLGYLYLYQRI